MLNALSWWIVELWSVVLRVLFSIYLYSTSRQLLISLVIRVLTVELNCHNYMSEWMNLEREQITCEWCIVWYFLSGMGCTSLGSCLGPLLFVLYFSKLFEITGCYLPNVHVYADDTQLYISISRSKWHWWATEYPLCYWRFHSCNQVLDVWRQIKAQWRYDWVSSGRYEATAG